MSARAGKGWGIAGERGQIEEDKHRQDEYYPLASKSINSSRQKIA